MVNSFKNEVHTLATHPYGCRVIQRILEYCHKPQTRSILDELFKKVDELVRHQYGNYVIQHILEKGSEEDKNIVVQHVLGNVANLSCHKYASNVVEKCVFFSSRENRSKLIAEVCRNPNDIFTMMKDQFANYVIQKMVDVADVEEQRILISEIKPHIANLKKYTYGKHIITKLDKQLANLNRQFNNLGHGMNNPSDMMAPIGNPNSGSHNLQSKSNSSLNGNMMMNNLNNSMNGLSLSNSHHLQAHHNLKNRMHNSNSPLSMLNGSSESTPIMMNGNNTWENNSSSQT